jgi:thioredoxin-related protein
MNSPRSFSRFLLIACGILAVSATEVRAIGIWHRDYASAMNEARTENKKLLIVFTGTDWIEICGKFYDEILGDPAFIETVSAKFALLKLEYPKDNVLPREEAAQKAVLREAYRVRGFPTVVLTDAAGRPFGLNGYQPLAPKEYGEQILAINAVHEEGLAVAKKATELSGEEKAKGLSRAIPDLPGALVARFYRPEIEAVLAADPEDSLKLAGPFRKLLAEADYSKEIQKLARESKWTEMIAVTDRHIAAQKLDGDALQGALLNRAGFERRAGKEEAATATLRQIVAIDAKSAPGEEAARFLKSGEPPAPAAEPTRATPLE